jgi:hypothetical protein
MNPTRDSTSLDPVNTPEASEPLENPDGSQTTAMEAVETKEELKPCTSI